MTYAIVFLLGCVVGMAVSRMAAALAPLRRPGTPRKP